MIPKIRKRDGRIVAFDKNKITEAMWKAVQAVGGQDRSTTEKLSEQVVSIAEEKFANKIPTVEDIQDIVEKVLIENGHAKVAKAYILYREQHRRLRDIRAMLLDSEKIVSDYMKISDWRVRENANIGFSFSGLFLHAAGSVMAYHVLNDIYPKEIAESHINGDFHLHDLSMSVCGYCAGWSLRQLLLEGFNGVPGRIESGPAKHFKTALGQIVNFFGTLQNEWAGAQAISSIDTYLAPFVRADNLAYEEVKQAIQEFVFSINVTSRWGSQSPFTNLTFDWTVPEDLAEEHVIIGGKLLDSKYKDYQKEMDMINRAFIEIMLEGDMNGRVFTFPIPTYNITKDFNWDSENTKLLFDMTAKYGLPYFQNFINSDLRPGDVRAMCCRLRLELSELRKKTGGLFGSGESTGSVGVVTINLPRIGYLSKSEDEFLERLERLIYLAKESLEIKRKVVERNLEVGLLPFTKRYLGTLKNHFSTIGLIGMNEACLNLLGKSIATPEGKSFALRVLHFMREKLMEYQEETGNIYNLEATPGEGVSYRLAKIDKQKYPNIITAGDREPYYTNSSVLPVYYTDDIFEALEHQDDLQVLYTGGCVEKGNKVLTNKGLLNIEYIVKNFEKLKPIKVVSFNPEKKVSEWDELVEAVAIDVEKKNKIRIKGERNLNIVTSDWHPFFILEKTKVNPTCPVCGKKVKNVKGFAVHLRWNSKCKERYKIIPKYQVVEKRADELKINDFILQNSTNLCPEKETELNEDLMWLIGFFIGDGCISEFIDNRGGNNLKRYKVRFFGEHRKSLERVAMILSKYFQTKVNVIRNEKRSKLLKEVSTSKKEVSEFFFNYGFSPGEKVYNVSIPQKVKESITKTNVFCLLAGLIDSDGTVDNRDGNIEYYTVSAKLAEDILEICTTGGILVSKREKPTKRKNEVNGWRLTIPSYQATKIKDNLNITNNPFGIKKRLSNRKKRHLSVVRVKEVSKIDVKDNKFYDLMTKKNHNYLAGKNSLVFVHNTVLHGFLGESMSSGEACKKLVKTVTENFRLPYFTITPTFSICKHHGYLKGEQFKCPHCGEEAEVYSRVVGYYRPVHNWNAGKQEEFKDRLEYAEEKAMEKVGKIILQVGSS